MQAAVGRLKFLPNNKQLKSYRWYFYRPPRSALSIDYIQLLSKKCYNFVQRFSEKGNTFWTVLYIFVCMGVWDFFKKGNTFWTATVLTIQILVFGFRSVWTLFQWNSRAFIVDPVKWQFGTRHSTGNGTYFSQSSARCLSRLFHELNLALHQMHGISSFFKDYS